jgi:hypothetical protein
MPLHYSDHKSYQVLCGYRRNLCVTEEMLGKRLFLQFDGAAHIATVYVNGKELAHHRCGYTAFRVEITDAVQVGDNLIAVKLDSTENPAVPPFGFVIDYLTYGGLYREVWLDIREESYLEDVFVSTPDAETVRVEATPVCVDGCTLEAEVTKGGHVITKGTFLPGESLTLPSEVAKFVEITDVDALAIAIGTAHGVYKKTPSLRIDRLDEIVAVCDRPLVLHGGSGTPVEQVKEAISHGITKINIYHDVVAAMNRGIKAKTDDLENITTWPILLFEDARKAMKEVIRQKIRTFGSNNRI